MTKIIKLYAAVITLVVFGLTFRVQTVSEMNKSLISDNYKLISMSKDLLNQIDTKQTEYTDLMAKVSQCRIRCHDKSSCYLLQ